MWRRIAVALLLVGFLSLSGQAAPLAAPMEQAEEVTRYFPFMVYRTLPLEVVITASGEWPGYPSTVYVYGYLRNLSDAPVHDVVLEVIETWEPYDPGGISTSYSYPVRFSPALTATLPGQVNPFSHSMSLGKASGSLGTPYLVDGRFPTEGEPRIVALEAVEWTYADDILRGTVRNGSAHTVDGVRIVIKSRATCSWRMAAPAETRLLPGQETAFVVDPFYQGCLVERMEVLGQGVVQE